MRRSVTLCLRFFPAGMHAATAAANSLIVPLFARTVSYIILAVCFSRAQSTREIEWRWWKSGLFKSANYRAGNDKSEFDCIQRQQ